MSAYKLSPRACFTDHALAYHVQNRLDAGVAAGALGWKRDQPIDGKASKAVHSRPQRNGAKLRLFLACGT